MDRKLLNSIEELQNRMEGLEEDYDSSLERREDFDTLKSVRTQISILKDELQLLASLLDGLPQIRRL